MHSTRIPSALAPGRAGPALARDGGCVSAPDGASGTVSRGDAQSEARAAPVVRFGTGVTPPGRGQAGALDRAARLFREGDPCVTILWCSAGTTGPGVSERENRVVEISWR